MPDNRVPARPGFREYLQASSAFVIAVAATSLGHSFHHPGRLSVWTWLTIGFVVIEGSVAVRLVARVIGREVTYRTALAAGAVVRYGATAVGSIVLAIAVLALAGVSLQRLLIGAGLISVVLGIAAQQSLANIFASLVLLVGRAFNVGDHIIIRSGTLGIITCEVRAIGLTYVTVTTDTGVMKIPNAVMAAAGIGRIATPDHP